MLESSETPINSNFGEFENYDIFFILQRLPCINDISVQLLPCKNNKILFFAT